MALGDAISLGIGSPASVEHFITLGLEASVDVLLSDGDTGYEYAAASAAAVASLVAGVSGAALALAAEPVGAEPSLVAAPSSAEPALAAGPPAGDPTYIYEP